MLEMANIFKRTKLQETALFMVSSSILMYTIANSKKAKFLNFWFYTDVLKKDKINSNKIFEDRNKCMHPEDCLAFSLKVSIYIIESVS